MGAKRRLILLSDGTCVGVSHVLKTWPDVFQSIVDGDKRHEYRRNDRGYERDQLLLLREYEPVGDRYSGRAVVVRIGNISHGPEWGIPEGFSVFTIIPQPSGYIEDTDQLQRVGGGSAV